MVRCSLCIQVPAKLKMLRLSFDRSNIAQTATVALATVAALVLLALVAAYWTWELFAPRSEPRAQAAMAAGGETSSAQSLFGVIERNPGNAPPTGIAIKLLGILAAPSGRQGYAVMQLEQGKILSVQEGEDVAPGIRLAEVAADHVILERAGIRETLAWTVKAPAGTEQSNR